MTIKYLSIPSLLYSNVPFLPSQFLKILLFQHKHENIKQYTQQVRCTIILRYTVIVLHWNEPNQKQKLRSVSVLVYPNQEKAEIINIGSTQSEGLTKLVMFLVLVNSLLFKLRSYNKG